MSGNEHACKINSANLWEVNSAKHYISGLIARRIMADAKRKGKRPPPFEGTRALVERQGWGKIICLTAKCFLLLPLQRLWQSR